MRELRRRQIISAPYKVGQPVKKEVTIYRLDASGIEGDIQKTNNTISGWSPANKASKLRPIDALRYE